MSPSPSLRWLPWHLNQINGFQLRKLECYKATNVTRVLGCRDPVAEATRRQAPKPSQKLRWLPWHVNYWRGCRRRVGSKRARLPVGCWVTVIPLPRWCKLATGAPGLIHRGNVTWQPEHPAHVPTQNKPNAKMAAAGSEWRPETLFTCRFRLHNIQSEETKTWYCIRKYQIIVYQIKLNQSLSVKT